MLLHQMGILTIPFIKTPSIFLETVPEYVWKLSFMVIVQLLFNQASLFSLVIQRLLSPFTFNTFFSLSYFLTLKEEAKMF